MSFNKERMAQLEEAFSTVEVARRSLERIRQFGVWVFLLSAAVAGLYSCAGIRAPRPVESPIVRIGLVQNRDSVAIEPRGDFYLLTRQPRPRKLYQGSHVWTATVVESNADSLEIYRLLFAESRDRDRIDRRLDELRRRGVAVERLERGEVLYAGKQPIADTRLQQLYYPQLYATEAAAQEALQRLKLDARVVRDFTTRARGKLCLAGPEGQVVEAEQAVRLSGPFFRISDLSVGEGFHWQRRQDRIFRGEIEILIDGRGKLTVVNVLPLEDYLRGVVPQEMSAAFPFAALKAQAIV
ncbi:SpoIID/LytB domain-containing protein, partial [candidate division KSB1 bacterium]|nr:SpoIID/LytB domain-containing protein [candidate division KSB1 bacterium]